MKSILQDKLLLVNTGVLGLTMTNVEMALKVVLLVLTIILTTIKIYKYLTNADTDTKK